MVDTELFCHSIYVFKNILYFTSNLFLDRLCLGVWGRVGWKCENWGKGPKLPRDLARSRSQVFLHTGLFLIFLFSGQSFRIDNREDPSLKYVVK